MEVRGPHLCHFTFSQSRIRALIRALMRNGISLGQSVNSTML
jgi:hypothetical protein